MNQHKIGIGTANPESFISLCINSSNISKIIANMDDDGYITFGDNLSKEDLREGIKVLLETFYVSYTEATK